MAELHQHIGEVFHRCYSDKNMICEEKVTEHMLAFIFSGEMVVYNSSQKVTIRAGEAAFIRKNHLVHKIKQPINTTPFSGVFLHLDSRLMKRVASLITIPNIEIDEKLGRQLYIPIEKNDFISGYFYSLDKYFTEGNTPSRELLKVKLQEMLIILLEQKPQLVPMLFDYTPTWRVDLMEFMNNNYLSELSIEEFAHYSGRSLSSFKREFAEASGGETPARWIMCKRLDDAMVMLKEGSTASDVYTRIGFKNLSHFSTAFKKHFGIAPTQIPNTLHAPENTSPNYDKARPNSYR